MSRCAIRVSVVAVLLAAPLCAAPVPPPPADAAVARSAAQLLRHRKVQKELKMTAEQRLAVLDGLADFEEEYEKKINDVSQMANVPDDTFEKLDAAHRKGIHKLLGDVAAKSLSAAQRKRLRQLDWRIRGAAAFTDPQVQKLLQLTDAQKKKATELTERQQNAADNYFENRGNEDDASRKAELLAARKDFLKQMETALTADQKAGWVALAGDAPAGFAADDLWLKIEESADAEPSDDGP